LEVRASGISDVGLQREGNEDAFSVQSSLGLYIVADGMGGHLAGEVASRVAVEIVGKSFRRWFEANIPDDELFGYPDASLSKAGTYIKSSIRLANRVIYEMATEYEEYNGMGTTIVTVFVAPDLIVAANVGDSRIYMIRDGRIERMSKDHTIVSEHVEMGVMTEEEAAKSPLRHILTRNLGSAENVEAEVFEIVPSGSDRFILCSDGLTDLANDKEILELALAENDPELLSRKLIDLALQRGGHDNTTVVTVFAEGKEYARQGLITKLGSPLADVLSLVARIRKKTGLLWNCLMLLLLPIFGKAALKRAKREGG
jgi:serine/threonine protein phosphatase PrpC